MYKPLPDKHNKDNKLDDIFSDGIYLGISLRNGEYYIGTPIAVVGSRTIMRRPLEDKWDKEFIDNIRGVPWNLEPSAAEQIKLHIAPEFDDIATERIDAKADPVMPSVRRTKLAAKDFTKHGFTPKCAGCNALRNNTPNPGHNEECRTRM
jgi:hypothetical protein